CSIKQGADITNICNVCDSTGGSPFTDVAEKDWGCEEEGLCDPWYTQYIYYAVAKGFIEGYNSGSSYSFQPDEDIMRIHALRAVMSENPDSNPSSDPRFQRLTALAQARNSYYPKCLYGAEDLIRYYNGGDTQEADNLLQYAILADRLDLFGNNCQVFDEFGATTVEARASFLQQSITRKEPPRYYSLTTYYEDIAIDPADDDTVNTADENADSDASYDYDIPSYDPTNTDTDDTSDTSEDDYTIIEIDGETYYIDPDGTLIPTNSSTDPYNPYTDPYTDPYSYYTQPDTSDGTYGSTAGQSACPSMVCSSMSGSACASIASGTRVTTVGELDYGEQHSYSSLWQEVSYNGGTYYSPYDSLNLGCSGSSTSDNSGNNLIQSVGVGAGMATRTTAPVYGMGTPYTWTMDLGGSYITQIYQTNNPSKYIALDYHLHETGPMAGTSNFHFNQKGVYADWGVSNHQVIGPDDLTINGKGVPVNVGKGLRYVGAAGLVIGAATDAYNIYESEDRGRDTTKVVGGWTGAWAGATAFASIGASTGAWIGGMACGTVTLGAAAIPCAVIGGSVGGFIGGMFGGVTGYLGGSYAGEEAYDAAPTKTQETITNTVDTVVEEAVTPVVETVSNAVSSAVETISDTASKVWNKLKFW
ncbi:S-layer homology domain-containing protein, partial [Patescibacteria group bacterium]|nr:S-layer homology domain-containing protein [Patescibacteria group bacterium]MBU1683460.1 S-layer homology domain-containing protein [Patescibacteria group bacterium]MBU1934929.1 S-layer homology domain-containing protein [Patescibacteria group bacterium]